MKKTGEILRKAREEKGLSLNEIGLSLKISSKVLKAIEEGNERQLPAKTFLRGFVQSYANYLHLDTDKILEIFYEEMGSTRPKPYIRENDDGTPIANTGLENATEATVTPISAKAAASRKADNLAPLQQKRNTKTVAAIVLGFILVALIIFTKKMIDKYSKEAEVPIAEVEQTMEGATPVTPPAETSDVISPEAPVEALTSEPRAGAPMSSQATPAHAIPAVSQSVTPKASPSVTPKASPVVTPTPKANPSPSPTVAAASPTPKPSPSASASPVAVAASPSPSPSPTPSPTEGKPVELIVEALDNVEIEYAAPNGKLQKIRLSAEQVHTFKSKSGLKINFNNGGAVNLILNGKEIGIPGDLGKSIKLSY